MTENNERSGKNFINLIASNKDHVFQNEGVCKIVINHLQSLLFVEPIQEEFKLISAMFKWKFFALKNILFVFADFEFLDFILVFKNEIRCKKVYDLICCKRAEDEITNDQIYQRILSPIFNQIIRIPHITISELLMKWMNKLDFHDKQLFIKMMKDDEIYDLIFLNGESDNAEIENKVQRKRKFSQVATSADSRGKDLIKDDLRSDKMQRLSSINFVKSVCEFKMVNIIGKGRFVKRLLVFDSDDKRFCYEYFRFMPCIFMCTKCKKRGKNVYAKIGENGNLLIQKKEHVCSKLQYSAEKYFDLQIIKKPNYEILESCCTKTGKVLIILNQDDRSQCHEFRGTHQNTFRCLGCGLTAVVYKNSMENEYIEILKKHECPFRPYNSEKFYKFKNFVSAPNFEIQTKSNGEKEKKTLIIFNENDKSKCYKYGFSTAQKLFICKSCWKQRLSVSAKLLQNSDGENYIILSNVQHVCESVEYLPTDEIILRQPDFKVMEENSTGIPKLFIFDSKNKNLCYIFSSLGYRYRCCGCHNILQKKKDGGNSNVLVRLSLCKNENGEYFIQMKNQKHLCQPKKYEPEKYEIKEPKIIDQFFFYRNKKYPNSVNVAIFHLTDSTLCYPFLYIKKSNIFLCSNCEKLKKFYRISIPKKDENEKEYFIHDQSEHACKPIKISSIQNSKFQRLQRNEFTFEKKSKKMEIEENRIVKIPNFEIRPNQKDNPEGKLVIFDRNERSLYFEYYYAKNGKIFVCSKCQKKKHRVTAKVHFDNESKEKFIEISKNEHICEPIKDEFTDKIINASDFMVINQNDETKSTKIIVFTSETKEFYYEYTATQRNFQCYACKKINKCVGVKLYTKENGEEYLLKMNNEHICEPKPYDSKHFEQPKTVAQSMFELYQNSKGEQNKRLIVFISEKKDLVYEYCFNGNSYICTKCSNQKKCVTAKLCENENEKYLKLSKIEHICVPKKYDPKNYKK